MIRSGDQPTSEEVFDWTIKQLQSYDQKSDYDYSDDTLPFIPTKDILKILGLSYTEALVKDLVSVQPMSIQSNSAAINLPFKFHF